MSRFCQSQHQLLTLQIVNLLLTVALLFGCVSQPFTNSPTEKHTSIQYAKRPNADYQLAPRGIYALNRETLFLFGGVKDVSDERWGPYYSLLLRSSDGGKHWHEVMQPVPGSEVVEIALVEAGDGWALVGWISEGPGPASLYHTTDYGESWELLSNIPFFGGHSATVDIQFFDNQHA